MTALVFIFWQKGQSEFVTKNNVSAANELALFWTFKSLRKLKTNVIELFNDCHIKTWCVNVITLYLTEQWHFITHLIILIR